MSVAALSSQPKLSRTLLPKPAIPVLPRPKGTPKVKYSKSEWLDMYPHIEKLYVRERWKLREVILYMEQTHHFHASEHMFKKRLAQWGFLKSGSKQIQDSVHPQPAILKRGTSYSASRSSMSTLSREAKPSTNDKEAAIAILMTKIMDWSKSYFESTSGSSTPRQSFEPVSYGFKLAEKLISCGHGALAGRVVRKSFLLVEDSLTLEGPAMVWNLHELLFNMTQGKEPKLLEIFIQHLLGMAYTRYPEAHPLVQILINLRRLASSSSLSHLRFVLTRAAILNAESLDKSLNTSHTGLYRSLLWDGCKVRFSAEYVEEFLSCRKGIPVNELQNQDPTAPRPMSNTDSIKELSQIGLPDPRLSWDILPGMVRATMEPTRSAEGSGEIPRSHFQIAANVATASAQLDIKDGAYEEAEEKLRRSIKLRVRGHAENDPRIVSALLMLRDLLIKIGRYGEAEGVEKQAMSAASDFVDYFGDICLSETSTTCSLG